MAVARRKYKDAFAGIDTDQLESFAADAVRVAREPLVRALRTVRFRFSHAGPMSAHDRIAKVQSVVEEALADEPASTITSDADGQEDVLLGPACPSCGANVGTTDAGRTICLQCGHELNRDE